MIKCHSCNFENPEHHKFCQACGGSLAIAMPPSNPISSLDEPEIRDNTISHDVIDTSLNVNLVGEITPINLESEATLKSVELETTDITASQEEFPHQPFQEESLDPISPAETKLLVQLRYAGLSDVGRERAHNEDGFRCISQTMTTSSHDREPIQIDRGLFVLCDGMGGHEGGEIASSMALDLIAESFKPFWTSGLPGRQTLREIIATANQAIYDRNQIELRREMGRMGTTLVILIIYGTEVAIAHVGDSRIYKVNREGLSQITRDHEVGIKLIDGGMDEATANSRPDAHQLTQALGPNLSASLEPAIEFFKLDSTTLFLLCSDGLSDNQIVETQVPELMSLLENDSDLKLGVKNLVQLGNDRNGYDNISAILVHCQIS